MNSTMKGPFDFKPSSKAALSCEAFSTLRPPPPQSLANSSNMIAEFSPLPSSFFAHYDFFLPGRFPDRKRPCEVERNISQEAISSSALYFLVDLAFLDLFFFAFLFFLFFLFFILFFFCPLFFFLPSSFFFPLFFFLALLFTFFSFPFWVLSFAFAGDFCSSNISRGKTVRRF